jgi:chromosome partitioning protein
LKNGGVFITQYDGRKVLNRDVVETINAHFKSEVLKQRLEISRWRKRRQQGMDI